jgi:CIC family chloride channel protein
MLREESSPGSFRERLTGWADAETLQQHEDKVLLVLTLIIGAVVGLVVVAFILVTENLGARMYPAGGAPWRRLIIPVAGALFSGFLLNRYFPNARGSGIPQTKTALFIHGGVIHFRTVLGKFFCSSLSLATGIALGREGPSVQVGAGIASSLGRRLGLSDENVRALVPIGAAAALAAAFNTPIAAVLFTLEEVMGDLHARVLGSIVLSSATSWIVLHLLLGDEPLFHVPAYQLVHPLEFGLYALLGLAGGLVSVAFVKLLLWQRKLFLRLPRNTKWIQPVAGGLLVGILGWFVPEVLGVGYGYVSQALNGQVVLGMMALLVLLKLVATSTCYASGNAGGIFGPSLFIGAMLGGAFGAGAHMLLPDYTGSVGAYALVGMGTAFAGIVRVPLASVIMIFEVTRDYSIIVPLMISNLVSYFISSQLQEEAIYEALQHQDGIYLPASAGAREAALVVRQGVREPALVLAGSETVSRAAARVPQEQDAWPVVENDSFLGMVTPSQLAESLKGGRDQSRMADLVGTPVSRADVPSDHAAHVHLDDPLDMALRRMASSGLKVLPVVSRTNLRQLVGVISLRDIMAAYGLEKGKPRPSEPIRRETRSPRAAFGGILAALVLALCIITFLSYFYRTQRISRAQESFRAGNEFMAADRYEEAIEQYRHALSVSHDRDQRLALALALLKGDHISESEIYLRELLRENPNSGPANLGLARALSETGDMNQAAAHYHQAIYGSWPKDPEGNRLQARLELIQAFGKTGAKQQAQAELMALLAEKPHAAAILKKSGQLLLEAGLPREAARVFQDLAGRDKSDSAARAGLGEADLVLGDFTSARKAFDEAAQLAPGNAAYQSRVQLAGQAMNLDPALPGLHAAERYQRSLRLLEGAVGTLDQCLAGRASAAAPETRTLTDSARTILLRHEHPRSYSDAADTTIATAEQVWGERIRLCGPATPAEEALSRVIAHLAR